MGKIFLQGQMPSMGGATLIVKVTWLDIVHFLTLHLVGIWFVIIFNQNFKLPAKDCSSIMKWIAFETQKPLKFLLGLLPLVKNLD
jgi:hypothetical protein